MAETTNAAPQNPPAPASSQNNGGNVVSPSGGGARPAWLPEGFEKPEDFRAKYDDYDKRWKEAEPRLKALEKWEKWGDPDTFAQNLAANVEKRDREQRARWEAEYQRQQQQTQQPRDPYDGYELLTPQQQAQVLQHQVAEGVKSEMQKLIDSRWTEAQGKIGEMDSRFSLLSRALSAKAANPDLDLNALWREAGNLATGDPQKLFELAMNQVLAPKQLQSQISQAVAAEKAKWEQEASNKAQAALVGSGNGSTTASFKETMAARGAKGKDGLRTKILQDMLAKGELTPGQL